MTETIIDYQERGTVVVVPDGATMANRAAQLIVDASQRARDDDRIANIALSGGSTPKAMGAILAADPVRQQVAWDHVRLFWGDERWVPLADPESNAGEAKRGFIDSAGIPADRVHPFTTENLAPEESASAMEDLIREHVPDLRFDLILLGMGDDGHTASLFPGTEAIQEHAKLVVSHFVPKLSATRLTFTPALINAARHVVFLVGGAGKAETLEEVLDGGIDVDRLPSQVVRPDTGTLTWLIDRAAAGDLERYVDEAD